MKDGGLLPFYCCDRKTNRNKLRKYLLGLKVQVSQSIMDGEEQHLAVDREAIYCDRLNLVGSQSVGNQSRECCFHLPSSFSLLLQPETQPMRHYCPIQDWSSLLS